MISVRTDSEYDSTTDLESTYFVETDLSDSTESHFSDDESTESWSYLKVFILACAGFIIVASLIFFGSFENEQTNIQQTTAYNNKTDVDSLRPSLVPTPRMAVIHDVKNQAPFDWIKFPYTVVTNHTERNISESYNYDELPDYSVFLHGHKSSWHTPPDFVQQVNEAKPDKVQMLGRRIWVREACFKNQRSQGYNQLSQMLHSRDFKQVAEETCLWTKRCCAEMVVSRKAIRQHPQSMYQKIIGLIEADPEQPWGWIFEVSWENMFNFQSCK